jgi:hypothetical protein
MPNSMYLKTVAVVLTLCGIFLAAAPAADPNQPAATVREHGGQPVPAPNSAPADPQSKIGNQKSKIESPNSLPAGQNAPQSPQGISAMLQDKWLLDAAQVRNGYTGKMGINFNINYTGIKNMPDSNIVISHHVKSLKIGGISVVMTAGTGEVSIRNKTGFGQFFLPEEIVGLENLKFGKYPVTLVLEGDIYKSNAPNKPLERWQVKLQEEIELNALIFEKGIPESQVDFESLSVEISGVWIAWQKPRFKVMGTGSVEFSMSKGPNDPERCKSTFNLKQEDLGNLNKLLEGTEWLTQPGANVPPGYTDATRIDIALERHGTVKKAWCHDRNPEPYGSLVNFLRRIYRQEYFLNRMTVAGEKERIDAFREIDQELRAAKDEPLAVNPNHVLDYQRFVPISVEVIRSHPKTLRSRMTIHPS